MRNSLILLFTMALAHAIAYAECPASAKTLKVRISVERPSGDKENIAGVVLSVSYPTDKLVIQGQGKEAAEKAVGKLADGIHGMYEDHDGELRLLFAKPEPLNVDPLCEITFHLCEAAKDAAPQEVSCRVTDASDPASNKLENLRCLVSAAS
jgi:hypothetical protein